MAGQIYAKLDGIDGESEDMGHEGFFDVESFDFGGNQNISGSTGLSTGRVNYDVATFTVKHDKNLAALFQYMNGNTPISEATIHWRQVVDDDAVLAIDMVLNDVKIISVHTSLQDEDGIGMNTMFTVGISFRKFNLKTASYRGEGGETEYEIGVGVV